MPSAMRYAIFGFLCASIAGLFAQAWQIVIIAWALGTICGLLVGLSMEVWERLVDRVFTWFNK